MQIDIKDIANLCRSIINEPETRLKEIKPLLNTKTESETEKSVIYLSVLKIFKSCIPLYKIRTLKDKVKFKKDNLEISKVDINILKMYSYFINKVCSEDLFVCYQIAVEVIEHFEHFNYIDIVIKKVLKGTLKQEKISKMCLCVLNKKIQNDLNGDLIFCIVNQMYETNYHSEVLLYLLNIKYLHEMFEIEKEEEIDKFIRKPKVEKFYKIKRSFNKQNRKIEKSRRIFETNVRKDEEIENKEEKYVLHRKIIDGLQRLYFLILRNKVKQKFKYVFIGIQKYKQFIRKEFHEGLYILLNDALNVSSIEDQLYCTITVLDIFYSMKYDFKRLVQALYDILCPFNRNLNRDNIHLIEQVVEKLFLNIKQPIKRVYLILEKLIIFGCIRYEPNFGRIVNRLGVFYDIDFNEVFRFKEEIITGPRDIDQYEIRPLFSFKIFDRIYK